jgi:tetratricopeptide (TPR) repeat protein
MRVEPLGGQGATKEGQKPTENAMKGFMPTVAVALAIAHLSAMPASAQGAKDELPCQADKVSDPDRLIAACTAQLESSNEISRQIEALMARASAYTSKHQNGPAVADLSRVIALDGNHVAALKGRAERYYLDSQYDRAIQDFNRVIRIAPDSNIFDARGNAFLQRGAYDRAIEDYNEAMRLDATNAQAFIDRGVAYYLTGKHEKAVADYSEAIRLNTTNSAAFANRAAAYNKLGQPDRALEDEDEAIRRSPTFADYYSNRGLTYAELHDYDRAIADYNEAIRLDPRANYLTNRGDAYQFKKEYDHAIADYNEALKVGPEFWKAYNNLGAAYRHKGDLDRAIINYEQAVRLHPSDGTAVENLKAVKRDRERLALVNPSASPTFECTAAKRAVEKAICSDEELVRLDRDMNAAYQSLLAKLRGTKLTALRQEQRTFVSTRDQMFGRPEYQLKKEMERRLAQLLAIDR